jgi:C4-dicarboxylate-specific signal transduction histidine kinase
LPRRLANQEKYAVLGKLASGMAHEVNNRLGGLFKPSKHCAVIARTQVCASPRSIFFNAG